MYPQREGCNPGLPVWAFVRCTPAMACSSGQPGAEMPPCLCISLPRSQPQRSPHIGRPSLPDAPRRCVRDAPQRPGCGQPTGATGATGQSKKLGGKGTLVHRVLRALRAGLGWAGLRFAALRTALYPSITCCDFGRPARPDGGKKGAIHGSFLKRSRLPSSHPPRPPLPLFSP